MDRDRYRAYARQTGVRARLPRPLLALDAVLLGTALVFVLLAGPRLGGVLSNGADEFTSRLAGVFPALQGGKVIDLPTTAGNVTAQLAADGVPDFTRDPQLKVSGRVPAFAMAAGRTVAVKLNGQAVATVNPDAAGAFSAALTLSEGPNAIELALLSGPDVVASGSYTVVLDRQPPALTVTRPAAGDSVEAPTVSVQGKAEPGATVIVNDRTVVPAQDGSFSDSFTASAGPLTITVVARDRAGNETTAKTAITVKPATQSGQVVVTVTLARTRVAPGGFVIADIHVTGSGQPAVNEPVTLSVGVITIGSTRTDQFGNARMTFAAPPNEGDAAVVVLASGTAGRATLTVAK